MIFRHACWMESRRHRLPPSAHDKRNHRQSKFGFLVFSHACVRPLTDFVRAPHLRLRCMGNLLCIGLFL